MQKTVEELQAEAAICALHVRYCRAVDRLDFDLFRTCFHPDARMEYGFFSGDVEAFVVMARSGLATYSKTTHFIGNQLVELDDDRAWAEHYTLATHRCPADATGPLRDFVVSFRYLDRLEQCSGDWRITKRVLIHDWWRTDLVRELGSGPSTPSGSRDRDDPSYRVKAE
jgi:hypothetical protein